MSLRTYPSAATQKLHVYNNNQDIHIGDTATSSSASDPIPTTSGFFTLQKGCKATTTFGFDEWKYVVEGTFVLTDGKSGKKERLGKGDVFFIEAGATITFETEDEGGKAFFVAVRPLNESRKAGVFAKL